MSNYFPTADSCPRHAIFPGVEASTYWQNGVMISVVDMQPNAAVEEHQHPHEQLGIALAGQAEFTIGGVTKTIRTGDRWSIPSNVRHKVIASAEGFRAIDAFSPPREE